jgi:hypothetical protein
MPLRPLPPPTLAALYPPARGYAYFDAAGLRFESAQGPRAPANRWFMAEHALLAYDEPAAIERTLAPLGYATRFALDRATSTFAYAALASDHGVLAFRGTQALTPGDSLFKLADVARNWLTDARFAPAPFGDLGRAHGGIAAALDTVWPALAPLVDALPTWWCTGHSLGGALAALAALRLRPERVGGLVTFGQPRTGCPQLARRLDSVPSVRVVNACDVVPRLPPAALGFEHGGFLAHLDADRWESFGATVREHLAQLPKMLKHGIGALTPIELIDHAPLHYAIKSYNVAAEGVE